MGMCINPYGSNWPATSRPRGVVSLRVFAKKIGLSSSHLQRIESGEQNVSLDTLEMVLDRLKVTLRDVFKG